MIHATMVQEPVPTIGRRPDVQHVRSYRARQSVLHEGDGCTVLHQIVSGWAYATRALENGRRQIHQILMPGDVFVLPMPKGGLSPVGIVALTDVHARIVRPDEIDVNALTRTAYHRLLLHASRLGWQDARQRIASMLVELHDRSPRNAEGRFEMPLTQDLIADLLGITSVHVNRTLHALRIEGLATVRRRDVVLHDRRALEDIAGYVPLDV